MPREEKMKKNGGVVKPMIFKEFNSRRQVDLIHFQTFADGEYKFMVTQDHLTKFVPLLNRLNQKEQQR